MFLILYVEYSVYKHSFGSWVASVFFFLFIACVSKAYIKKLLFP